MPEFRDSMRTIKVLELLHALKPHEKASFSAHLASPIIGSATEHLRLMNALEHMPLSTQELPKATLFAQLFPAQPFDDQRLRYLLSEFTERLEHYFLLRHLSNEKEDGALLLLDALHARETTKAYQHAARRFKTIDHLESAKHFHRHYRAAEIRQKFTAQHGARDEVTDYVQLADNLDRFYFLRKLQLQCERINNRNILDREFEVSLIDEITRHVLRNGFLGSPLIETYYQVLQLLSGKEPEAAFESLLQLLEAHRDRFSVDDLNNVYQYVKNHCIRRINLGDEGYRERLFGIYRNILVDDRLMHHDYLSPWEYKNIVTLGLRLRQEAWVADFIERHLHRLPPHERGNAHTYNSAMLCYYRKQYRQAVRLLQSVEFTDLYYQLDARSILLKVYFETYETESLLHHISAFKIFLRRNKLVSAYQRKIYENYIRYALKIFRSSDSEAKRKALAEEIRRVDHISDRTWLLEQLA
jgi:hypothetical protein